MNNTPSISDLAAKRVVVTGGATGIGAAATEAFLAAGCQVLIHCLHGLAEAETIAAGANPGTAHIHSADLTEKGAARDLIDIAVQQMGGVDILVNNAGGMVGRRQLEAIDDEFIDAVFDLNVRSLIHACAAVAPVMRDRGAGSIINVSSISARSGGSPGSAIYSGAKAFVSAITRTFARELAPDNIRVNAISPGTIATAFHERHSTPDKLERTRATIPLARLGMAGDCAGTCLYLASESLSGYVTGQVIEVNGGQLMP